MSLIKGVFTVSSLTLLSRIFGYIRDMFISAALGTGIAGDMFVVILKLPNVFRSLFGEGALNTAFIPIYSKTISNKNLKTAFNLASIIQTILIISVSIFCLIIFIFMPFFIDITVPGFSDDPLVIKQLIKLSRITIFYLAFISLIAFYGGVLNSHGKYAAFAFASVIMNICIIIAAKGAQFFSASALEIIAYSISIAGLLELLWMLYAIKKEGITLNITRIKLFPEVKEFFKKLPAAVLGSGVCQINTWLEMMIVSHVAGGMSTLYYADRITQLPLSLIGIALGTVLMPSLARNYGDNNLKAIQKKQEVALEFSLLLAMPSACALFILSYPILSILFQGGAFTAQSTFHSAEALTIYSIALPAQIVSKVFLSSFYASGDIKTPVKIAIFSIFINLSIALFLIGTLGYLGMAWATVCSSWGNIFISYIILARKNLFKIPMDLLWKAIKILACSIFMGIVLLLCLKLKVSLLFSLTICIIIGGGSYIIACLATKVITVQYIKDNLL